MTERRQSSSSTPFATSEREKQVFDQKESFYLRSHCWERSEGEGRQARGSTVWRCRSRGSEHAAIDQTSLPPKRISPLPPIESVAPSQQTKERARKSPIISRSGDGERAHVWWLFVRCYTAFYSFDITAISQWSKYYLMLYCIRSPKWRNGLCP